MNRTRLQFDFTPEAVAALDAIVDQQNAASRAEIVRKALRLYQTVMESIAGGESFQMKGVDGTVREIILL